MTPESQRGLWTSMQSVTQTHSSSIGAFSEQKASNLVFPRGYHQVRMLCKYRGGGGEVVLKRKAASLRHLFTCTSNRRKIENVKIAL